MNSTNKNSIDPSSTDSAGLRRERGSTARRLDGSTELAEVRARRGPSSPRSDLAEVSVERSSTSPLARLVDLEAEKAVLGSCLIEPMAIFKVAAALNAGDFYRLGNQHVFSAMRALADTQTPIDVTTLADQLEKVQHLGDVGGYAGITDLFIGVPTALYVEHYARIVAEKATLRRLLGAAEEIAKCAYEAEDAEGAVDAAEAALLRVTMGKQERNSQALGDIMAALVDRLGAQGEGSITGIPTGFTDLDRMIGGLQRSDLIIMAGRPGMGKSSAAMTIAAHAARKYDQRVMVFSLEMSKEQLAQRLTSAQTGIDSNRLRLGKLNDDDDWGNVMHAANELSALPMTINDESSVTVDYVRREARRVYAEQGLDLIVIDYLQLMSASGGSKSNNENRQQEISYISRNLKAMAKELHVPVIALSQLSRAVEARADKRPMLSDLRESGAIEADADIVLFLYRDDYYDEESDRQNIAEMIIAKHRHGATGTICLYFQKELTLFRDLEIERTEFNNPPPATRLDVTSPTRQERAPRAPKGIIYGIDNAAR